MILYEFDYERPIDLEQAASQLRRLGKNARLAAGGTALFPSMRVDNDRPDTIVSLAAMSPEPPKTQPDGSIRIHSLMRLAAIERSPVIEDALPMLARAASVVGSNQIRHMATLGGNLCQDTRCLYLNQKHDYQFKAPCYKRGGEVCFPFPNNAPDVCWSVYMSDIAPALIALDAQAEVIAEGRVRLTSVESLFSGSGMTPLNLAGDEIVRAIIVPAVGKRFGWGYLKSARRGGMEYGVSIMSVALTGEPGTRSCRSARIVVGAIRERPVRVTQAESMLAGSPLDDQAIARTAAAVAKEISPLPHHGFTRSYIRDDIRVKFARVLRDAVERMSRTDGREGGRNDE